MPDTVLEMSAQTPHFRDGKTEAQRGGCLLHNVTQPVKVRILSGQEEALCQALTGDNEWLEADTETAFS